MWFAVYKAEDSVARCLFELESGDLAPIHMVDEEGAMYERIGMPYEADTLEEALEQASEHCFV